ncbi:MAG: hypothetical protein ACK5GN_10960 [Pseudomonadota bacterium]|jgi:hypothetical protein
MKVICSHFLVFALLAIVGCERTREDSTKKSVAFDPKATLETSTQKVGLYLLDPGEQPHHMFRYKLVSDADYRAVMKMNMNMTMKMNGQAAPTIKTPTMVTPLRIRSGTLDNGWLPLTGEYESVDVADTDGVSAEVISALKSQLQFLTQIKMNWQMDARGSIQKPNYEVPEDMPAQAKEIIDQTMQFFRNLLVVMPEEAIGNGATWLVVFDDMKIGGMTQTVRMLFVAREVMKDSLVADSTVLSVVPDQKIVPDQVELAGVTMKVFAAKNFSSGEIEINTNHLFPNSKLGGGGTMRMEMSGGPFQGQTRLMETNVEIKGELRRADSGK